MNSNQKLDKTDIRLLYGIYDETIEYELNSQDEDGKMVDLSIDTEKMPELFNKSSSSNSGIMEMASIADEVDYSGIDTPVVPGVLGKKHSKSSPAGTPLGVGSLVWGKTLMNKKPNKRNLRTKFTKSNSMLIMTPIPP